MTTFGLILFVLLIILTGTSLFFTYKYIKSIFNSKYFLFFIILGGLIISTLFLIPKTSSSLITIDEINISTEERNLEENKTLYEDLKHKTSKERIKNLKKEKNRIRKEIKSNPNETKQNRIDTIQSELDSIPNTKIEMRALKKSIRKQLKQLKMHKFSIFMKQNAFVIFICSECLFFILFILFIIGTIKKPEMLLAYEQKCKRLEEEKARKREAEERRKEEMRIEEERKRQEKIIEIAKYFESKNLKFLDVQNACLFVKEYEDTLYSYNKTMNSCSKVMNISVIDTSDSILEGLQTFGEKQKAKKVFNEAKEKLEELESQKKGQYLQAKAFLSALPDKTSEFCEKYGSEIINTINKLHEQKEQEKNKILLEQKQKQKEALEEKVRQQEIEKKAKNDNIAMEAKKREEDIQYNTQKNKLLHSIKFLKDSINVLRLNYAKNNTIDLSALGLLEQKLDVIFELKAYLPQNNNDVEDCKNILDEMFIKCESNKEIQTEAEIIKHKFDDILSK